MRKTVIGLAAFGLWVVLAITAAWGQDFQKSYNLTSGGTVSISSVSGDISVAGANVATLSVRAIREGRDKDVVEIVDESTPDHVSLKVQYPKGGGSYEASVRFVVQVPTGSRYKYDKLTTASGDIEVTNVAGDFIASTASGDVTISQFQGNITANTASGGLKITNVQGDVQANSASGDVEILGAAGMVSARTASGDVKVELTRVDGNGEMKFASASGDVTVKVPNQLNAQIQMSTSSGDIKSDFPLNIEKTEGGGEKASGSFGAGTVILKMSAASGDIHLVKF
jgi:DUF4097 and DUF4098 domain-containing protein YvlB